MFRAKESGHPGAGGGGERPNRVDEKKVATLIGEKISRADADLVSEGTGFAIGGVPPVGHARPPITLIDEDLQNSRRSGRRRELRMRCSS